MSFTRFSLSLLLSGVLVLPANSTAQTTRDDQLGSTSTGQRLGSFPASTTPISSQGIRTGSVAINTGICTPHKLSRIISPYKEYR